MSTAIQARAERVRNPTNPTVSWPTILLWGVAVLVWMGALTASVVSIVPWWLAALGVTVAAYVLFTPMHDASHGAVARSRLLNGAVGRLSAFLLLSPYIAFRWAHLNHHRHTNDHEHDPDAWSGRGPAWQRPLRWATQDLHYYVRYLAQWSQRPVAERVEVVATLGLVALAIGALCWLWSPWMVVLCWVVPVRLAITALAYLFDYLPHRPHDTPSKQSRFEATFNISGRGLSLPMMFQNYHLVHHLYPGVPFYRYSTVWRLRRSELLARGARWKRLAIF